MNDAINTTGILWAYHLDGTGSGQPLADAADLFAHTEAGFSWLHIHSDAPDVCDQLRQYQVDDKVIDALTANETRPTAMALEGGVFVVLRGVNLNPGADPDDMISVRLWLTEKTVISARKRDRRLLSITDLRDQIDARKAPINTGEFLVALSERIATRIGDVVDQMDDDITHIETHIGDIHLGEIRSSLSDARRASASIRRYLAPQKEALDALLLNRALFDSDVIHSFKLQADRMTRYVEDLDLLRERALVLQGELQNRIAEQQNVRMYVLSIVAAIFLPLSFLTGVFGMNVAGLPGMENPRSFYYLLIGMGILGVLLIVLMRWKKWF